MTSESMHKLDSEVVILKYIKKILWKLENQKIFQQKKKNYNNVFYLC